MTGRRAQKRKLSTVVDSQESSETGLFSQIPRHNQMDILKKLEFNDLARFAKCSKESSEVAENFRHILPLKAKLVQFKSNVIRVQYDDFVFEGYMSFFHQLVRLQVEFFEVFASECYEMSLEEFCKNMRCTARTVKINRTLEHSVLNSVINVLKVEKIIIGSRMAIPDRINPPETLNELVLKSGLEIEEADFLHFAPAKISAQYEEPLTLSVINRLLMEWYQGKRRIEKFSIRYIPKEHMEILEYLEYTVLPKTEILRLMKKNKKNAPNQVYSLGRPDGKSLHVAIFKRYNDFHLIASESDMKDAKEWLLSMDWQSV